MSGGKSGLFPGIERLHQSEEYTQWKAEEDLLREVGRDRLVELAQTEKDGRLVVLPAKKVFELTYDAGKNCDMRCDIDAVERCDLCKKGELVIYEVECKQEHIDKIGKTVFLSRKEAESALKGGAE